MNIKLIVIAGILVLVLVIFGRNPASERREAKEAALVGKDKLVESIKEHNSGKSKFGASMFSSGSKIVEEKPVTPAPAKPAYPVQPSVQTVPVAPKPQPEEYKGYYPPPPVAGQ